MTAETRRTNGQKGPIGNGFPPDPGWYRDAIVYEVPIRAYMDANGDGVGDFKGLTSRLDYLRDLGVTAIWVLPFYPSPLRDDGYDIADYTSVHPDYGTLRDARTFIREANRRDLRVITELVFNHTSDQHPWFQRARRAAPGSPERDWYVWSDTPDRYPEVRVIFKDFEASNWAWDPVAKAYFWHRFYSNQPDLNFDSPAVQAALLRIVDFWLEAGVDGLRLDAIPYLYERDGSNGENLPETHAFLKRLRRHIDERFSDRMLLAEANQWPEDSVAYFGEGDECHMAFHFPLMPRMFMALRMEDRDPIIDILEQTPDLPEGGQWALFLRNHDELTLEMVTDEERDYMYRVYAADPQARINLGIRRRLAPLLGNDRRRIELMNGLLFSLPGTPVIYYGDEIGMGDNVYVGDRNGVRTPMQWSSDRNAGFSRANRQALYLPVVTDPEYHHEAVNVEAQQANQHSLLWWMKRIVSLRKRHPAFGRGSMRFLAPENRRILAYVREYEGQVLLVVANLSRFAQWTELELGAYAGHVPVELFGSGEFPPIGEEPWLIHLGPHAFFWFRLSAEGGADDIIAAATDLPELTWRGDLVGMLTRGTEDVADVLLRWTIGQRWYHGKARTVQRAALVDAIGLPGGASASAFALLEIEYRDGEPETYVLALTATADVSEESMGLDEGVAIARLVGADGSALLLDGAAMPATFETLLGMIAGRRHVRGVGADLIGRPEKRLKSQGGPLPRTADATPMRADQSNTSAVFSDRFILKLFRTLQDGPNPDLELVRFLVDHGFTHVPPVLGSVEVRRSSGQPATMAMLQAFVPNEGDLWSAMSRAAADFLDTADPATMTDSSATGTAEGYIALGAAGDPPDDPGLASAVATAAMIGRRLGELHTTFAGAGADDPDFAPEPLTQLHKRAMFQSMRRSAAETMRLLGARLGTLSAADRAGAERLMAAAGGIDAVIEQLRRVPIDGERIRVHGDLHLGQLLAVGDDVMFIDFEGEPTRPLSERRLKRPALTDLAGMVRSFGYAADHSRLSDRARLGDDDAVRRSRAAAIWSSRTAAACITAYRATTAGARFVPAGDAAWCALLDALLVGKACYELRYELGSRPDWVGIPMSGLLALAEAGLDLQRREDGRLS